MERRRWDEIVQSDDGDDPNSWPTSSNSHSSAYWNHGSSGIGRVTEERFGTFDEIPLINEISKMIGEQYQNVFHAVERVSARLTQIESRARHLESLLEDVKDSVETDQQRTDGKLRQLENILGEVQIDVQFLRDKQDIADAQLQLQLAKLQLSRKGKDAKGLAEVETSTSVQSPQPATTDSGLTQALSSIAYFVSPQAVTSTAYSGSPQALPSTAYSGSPQALASTAYTVSAQAQPSSAYSGSALALSSTASLMQPAQAAQASVWQLPENYSPSVTLPQYNPPPTHMPFLKNDQCLTPPPQMLQQTPRTPLDPASPQYPRTSSAPQFSQAAPTNTSSQWSPQGFAQQAGKQHFNPSSRFPSYTSQSPYQAINKPDYDHLPYSNRSSESRYGGSSSDLPHRSATDLRAPLPLAQFLPCAIPTASPVAGSSDSSGSGNKIPVDDVIDKVAAMGFRRDLVRLTVKKLTDNGKVVDLNSVLDQITKD